VARRANTAAVSKAVPKRVDTAAQLLDLDRADCEESLYQFVRHGWKYIDPAPFAPGWHLEAISEHLEAVVSGQIKRLVINVPPRHCKSILTSVAFPAWTWAQQQRTHTSGPGVPFLFASYGDDLSRRDSVRCRRLIESAWYQQLWGDRFTLAPDQNTKGRFTNDQGGERLITSIGGRVTGEGGNCFVAGTLVSTPTGDVPIESLVAGQTVLAFDVATDRIVSSRVVATAKRTSDEICAIHAASGHSITCTVDHPIYSPGRGFISAGELGQGDRLLIADAMSHGAVRNNVASPLRPVRQADAEASVCGAQSAQATQSRRVLLKEMLFGAPRDQELQSEILRMVPIRVGEERFALLRRSLQRICRKSTSDAAPRDATNQDMRSLRQGIRGLRNRLLLGQMFKRRALVANGGRGKFKVSRAWKIFESICRDALGHFGTRRLAMCGVQNTGCDTWRSSQEIVVGNASYKRKYKGQQTRKFDHALHSVSSTSTQWYVTGVADVERLGVRSLPVYDIQVEGQSNFFANGILVHNCIVIDDPNAANEMESEATLETTLDWWRISMPTRPNDQQLSAIVIIQQRLAQNDLTGHIQEFESDGWDFLVLPGRFESWRKSHVTSIGWSDPRTEEGEVLWPEKMPESSLKRLEARMGKFVFAGQIQQRPAPKGGGIIERDWWLLWDKEEYPPFDYICAMVDTAYTAETYNDPSAMIVWGIFTPPTAARVTRIVGRNDDDGRGGRKSRPSWESIATHPQYVGASPRAMMIYAWRERLEFHQLVGKVAATASKFKCSMVMIENKAAGISLAQEIRRLYFNELFSLQMFDPKSQDKTARLYAVQPIFQEGLVFAPDTAWAEMVIDEVAQFNPSRKNNKDDLTDCVSMGMKHLRESGMLARSIEIEVENEARKQWHGREMPLYPV